jgi:hypothetical protein
VENQISNTDLKSFREKNGVATANSLIPKYQLKLKIQEPKTHSEEKTLMTQFLWQHL